VENDRSSEELPAVLLVDDIPANLIALEAVLEPLGCDLVKATSAKDGLEELLKREFAVLLLDVRMPQMDGYQMAKLARGAVATRGIPIIFITAAHQSDDTMLHGYGSGAVDVLFKPLNATILRSKVQVFVDLFRTRRELERAQQEQRELTEFIVHDLKNPLTVVHTALEFAKRKLSGSPPSLTDTIAEASEATARVRNMIEDLLMISRMEHAAFSIERQPLDLAALLGAVIHSFARRAQAEGIRLAPPPENVPEIQGDANLLQRVFENILDNALRHTPHEGRVAVTVRQGDGVEIVVSNDGPSIPESDRARIFEKFGRGQGDSNVAGNTGLGLHFCQRVVEAHGGDIDVFQTAEWPTSFRIRLPD
jgi:signal transduction histidine kinase